jgi:uncharacterized membrane protein YagU involved in acid resistance
VGETHSSSALVQYDRTNSALFSVYFVTHEVTFHIPPPSKVQLPLCFQLVPNSLHHKQNLSVSTSFPNFSVVTFQSHLRFSNVNYAIYCILASCYIRLTLNICCFLHQCNTFTSYFLLIVDMFRPHTAIFRCYSILSRGWCSVMPTKEQIFSVNYALNCMF